MINKKVYNEQGFLLLKNYFEREEIEAVRAEAKKVFLTQIKKYKPDLPDLPVESDFNDAMYNLFEIDFEGFVNCGKQVQHLISLHRLGTDPRIVADLKSLGLSCPVISVRPVLYFNSPRLAKKEDYWRLGPHQDWRSSQGSLDSVTVWIPLVDIDRALGALEVVPGSHKWGLLPSEKVSYYGKITNAIADCQFISMEVAQGDAFFFSSFLVHQSGTNYTPSIRWSCHFRYNNFKEQTFIERGYPHPFSYKPQEDLITPGFPTKDLLDRLFD